MQVSENGPSIIDVARSGIDSTGTTDILDSLRTLIDSAPDGATIYFPRGTYWADPKSTPPGAASVRIQGKTLSLVGEGTLRNISFDFIGAATDFFESPSPMMRGDIAGAHLDLLSPRPGDILQLLSSVSAYSKDAGAFQAAGPSPSSGKLYSVPFCEFVRVYGAGEKFTHFGTALRFSYPKGSRIRQVYPLSGIRVEGLSFDMRESRDFRTLRFDLCRDITVKDCAFEAGDGRGRHVQTRDCWNVRVSDCLSTRMPHKDAKGAGWNSFLFGSGTQSVTFENNEIEGDRQAFDVTSFDGGHREGENVPGPRTSSVIRVSGNRFSICHDAVTTHPGTYFVNISSNFCLGVSTGIRLRSNTNIVSENQIESARSGLCSSCYLGDTIVTKNIVRKASMRRYPGQWIGFDWLPLTGEANVEELIGAVLVTDNVVSGGGDDSDIVVSVRRYARYKASHPQTIRNNDGSGLWVTNNILSQGSITVDPDLADLIIFEGNGGNYSPQIGVL